MGKVQYFLKQIRKLRKKKFWQSGRIGEKTEPRRIAETIQSIGLRKII